MGDLPEPETEIEPVDEVGSEPLVEAELETSESTPEPVDDPENDLDSESPRSSSLGDHPCSGSTTCQSFMVHKCTSIITGTIAPFAVAGTAWGGVECMKYAGINIGYFTLCFLVWLVFLAIMICVVYGYVSCIKRRKCT